MTDRKDNPLEQVPRPLTDNWDAPLTFHETDPEGTIFVKDANGHVVLELPQANSGEMHFVGWAVEAFNRVVAAQKDNPAPEDDPGCLWLMVGGMALLTGIFFVFGVLP